LYVELKLASVVFANDVDKVNETRRVILAQHGMSPSDFHEHYVRLMDHPESWRSFQERVIAKVDEYQVSRKGDTANGK
jgi:4-hydroxy-3-methylbut-2-enyl diphosphate reductase IspH